MNMQFKNKKIAGMERLFFILLTATLFSCKKNNGGDAGNSYPKTVSIEYRISSTASGITKVNSGGYTSATGGDTFYNDESGPFSKKFGRTVNLGDDIGISALHNNSANSTPFHLQLDILVDGSTVKTETFIGAAAVIGAIVYLFP
jgi:hypothetical protein